MRIAEKEVGLPVFDTDLLNNYFFFFFQTAENTHGSWVKSAHLPDTEGLKQ